MGKKNWKENKIHPIFFDDITEKDIFSKARHVGVFAVLAVLLDAAPGFLAGGNAWVNAVQIVHFLFFSYQ